MSRRVRISASEARRIALAASAFDRERPGAQPDARHFRRVIDTLGLLQLDFVNVLVPAHFLVLWSRLGAYDRARLEDFVYGCGDFTEQWAHEASIVPAGHWRLLAHRREAWEPWKNNPILRLDTRAEYLDAVLEQVREQGALTSQDLPPVPGPKRNPGDWHRSVPRWALEYHFARGDLAVQRRLPNFQRVYDLPERVLSERHLACDVGREEADRELLRRAAGALGVATRHDLADYYRMSPRDAQPRIDELVDSGDLSPVAVEGWDEQAYLSRDARFPRSIPGASLLSPFDPVVWYRPRAERLFDFHYRIEIYVPESKRKWGYYVLPFRVGDDIMARVDLKAERGSGQLLVRHAYAEDGHDNGATAAALAEELRGLANWLELDALDVRAHNAFSKRLEKLV
ncbi:MAG: crosslink repair DNA glycosylase YcaQ family protein [Woeseiaceae bacterium]|nr:crosslink repair DNA glycosylase YcaQ family protein [Woeseiaceae bacterium]